MKRVVVLAAWVGLAVVVIATLVVVSTRSDAPSSADRVHSLARELRCPTCQSESVFESRSATADAIRSDLERRVALGESDDEIKAAYVERYTEWILLAPSDSGLALVVWSLPILVVLLGGGAVVAVVWRGRERRQASAQDAALVEELRSGRAPT